MNSNEISLINVLEDITPDSFPHTIQQAVAVSLWNFLGGESNTEYQAMLLVKAPGNAEVRIPMNLTTKGLRCRAIQGVLEIPVSSPGDVEFEVLLNGEHAASHVVKVHSPELRRELTGGERMSAGH